MNGVVDLRTSGGFRAESPALSGRNRPGNRPGTPVTSVPVWKKKDAFPGTSPRIREFWRENREKGPEMALVHRGRRNSFDRLAPMEPVESLEDGDPDYAEAEYRAALRPTGRPI